MDRKTAWILLWVIDAFILAFTIYADRNYSIYVTRVSGWIFLAFTGYLVYMVFKQRKK